MGEAKRKNRARDRALQECPHCVYCGGVAPATTRDHFPPRSVISIDKQNWPEDFKFSACDSCNNGASKLESDMKFFSRIFSLEGDESCDNGAADYIKGAETQWGRGRKRPMKLLEEIKEGATLGQDKKFQKKYGYRAVDIAGVEVKKIIHCFAAKMGFAFHYRCVKKAYGENRPVLSNGAVYPFYVISNVHLFDRNIDNPMSHIVELMEEPEFLSLGTKNQFFCQGFLEPGDGIVSIHRTVFRKSLDIYALVCERAEGMAKLEKCVDGLKDFDASLNPKGSLVLNGFFKPGFLKKDRKA